jgi:hypothetical protein
MHARRRIAALGGALLTLASCSSATGNRTTQTTATAAPTAIREQVSPSASDGTGAWCWFADPRAVQYAGQSYVGWLDADGNVVVASYDAAGRRSHTTIVRRRLGADDHDNPVLLVEPDGRLTVFYSRHDGRGGLMYRRTDRPRDIGAWGPERRVPGAGPRRGWAYPNPQHLAAERRTFLFWRGLQWDPTFATRRDGGRWSRPRMLLRVPGQSSVERPYIKFDGNGRDRIDFAFTPSHPSKYPTSIYYARYLKGRFARADGSRIATLRNLPLLPRQADTVYDARKNHVPAWIYDVGVDRTGQPVVVYALIRGPRDHRYVYAAWKGRRWVRRPIVAAGGTIVRTGTQPFYSGGISLDHSDPRVVYLSRPVGRHHEIERWTTRDQGATWTHRAITSDSTADNLRPVVPRGHTRRGVQLLWMRGVYRHYLHYRTRIVAASARLDAPKS